MGSSGNRQLGQDAAGGRREQGEVSQIMALGRREKASRLARNENGPTTERDCRQDWAALWREWERGSAPVLVFFGVWGRGSNCREKGVEKLEKEERWLEKDSVHKQQLTGASQITFFALQS